MCFFLFDGFFIGLNIRVSERRVCRDRIGYDLFDKEIIRFFFEDGFFGYIRCFLVFDKNEIYIVRLFRDMRIWVFLWN